MDARDDRRARPWPRTLAELRGTHAGSVVVRAVAGSHLYGLATEHSDEDERGLFAVPLSAYGGLQPPQDQVQDERGDVAFYSLRKFLLLAAKANPNALELLFVPDDCVLQGGAAYEHLRRARDAFVSRQCFETHVGYARTQIGRARGQNKWVNNPQPERPPRREDWCRVVLGPWPGGAPVRDEPQAVPPLRPRLLRDSGIDLKQCHCASMEHIPSVFRLYHYGPQARGVFRDAQIVCEAIPKEDEFSRLIGLLLYDEAGYERALRDHRHYWTWRNQRNERRWLSQERGEIDYDAKNLMHTIRLVWTAAAMLRDGAPKIRFDGAERDYLMQVRAGTFGYEQLLERVEAEVADLTAALERCDLPAVADEAVVERLLREVTEMQLS